MGCGSTSSVTSLARSLLPGVQFGCITCGTFCLVTISEICTGTSAREYEFLPGISPSSGNGTQFSGALSPVPCARSDNFFIQFSSIALNHSPFLSQWSLRTFKTVSRTISAFGFFFFLSVRAPPSASPLQWHECLVLFWNIGSGYLCPSDEVLLESSASEKLCFSGLQVFKIGAWLW